MSFLPHEKADLINALNALHTDDVATSRCSFFCAAPPKAAASIQMGIHNHTNDLIVPEATVIDIEDPSALDLVIDKINQYNRARIKAAEHTKKHIRLHHDAGQEEKLELADQRPEIITVRVVAGGWSLTGGIIGDVVLRLKAKQYHDIAVVDRDNAIIACGPDIEVGDLHQAIYKMGFCLPSASLIPKVKIGGLIANPCHGTGINQPAMAGLVHRLQIKKPTGEYVWVDKSHPHFNEIVGSNFGNFGIITRIELKCMPRKKLKVERVRMNYEEFVEDLKKNGTKNLLSTPYTSVMWTPRYTLDEMKADAKKEITVIKMTPVDYNEPDVNYPPKGVNAPAAQKLMMKLNNMSNLPRLLSAFPELGALYMNLLVAYVEVTAVPDLMVGPFPDIWHFQVAYPNKPLGDDDFQFNIGEKDPSKLIAYMKDFKTLLLKYPGAIIDAVFMRFNKGFNGGLNPGICGKNELVTAFDVVSSPLNPVYAKFRPEFQKMSIETYGCRNHPAKSEPALADPKKMYGEQYTKYCEAVTAWSDVHTNMFINVMNRQTLSQGIEFNTNIDDVPLVQVGPKSDTFVNDMEEIRDVLNMMSDAAHEFTEDTRQHLHNFRDRLSAIFSGHAKPQAAHATNHFGLLNSPPKPANSSVVPVKAVQRQAKATLANQ